MQECLVVLVLVFLKHQSHFSIRSFLYELDFCFSTLSIWLRKETSHLGGTTLSKMTHMQCLIVRIEWGHNF